MNAKRNPNRRANSNRIRQTKLRLVDILNTNNCYPCRIQILKKGSSLSFKICISCPKRDFFHNKKILRCFILKMKRLTQQFLFKNTDNNILPNKFVRNKNIPCSCISKYQQILFETFCCYWSNKIDSHRIIFFSTYDLKKVFINIFKIILENDPILTFLFWRNVCGQLEIAKNLFRWVVFKNHN